MVNTSPSAQGSFRTIVDDHVTKVSIPEAKDSISVSKNSTTGAKFDIEATYLGKCGLYGGYMMAGMPTR